MWHRRKEGEMPLRTININLQDDGEAVIEFRGPYEGSPRLCRLRLKAASAGQFAQGLRTLINRAATAHESGTGLVTPPPPAPPPSTDLD